MARAHGRPRRSERRGPQGKGGGIRRGTPDLGADRHAAERGLALRTGVTVLAVTVVIVAVAAAVRGFPGFVAALIGAGFVSVSFGAAAAGLAWAGARAPHRATAVLAGGAVARLMVYALALAALSRVEQIDRTTLAVAAFAAVVATLPVELGLLARSPQLFGVVTAENPAHRGAVGSDPGPADRESEHQTVGGAPTGAHREASEKEQTR